jgi:hypothetical protein
VQTKWSVGGAGVFNWNEGVTPPVFGQLRCRRKIDFSDDDAGVAARVRSFGGPRNGLVS